MKNINVLKVIVLAALVFLTSCSEDNEKQDIEGVVRATPEEFTVLRMDVINDLKQDFQFDASSVGMFTTASGVQLTLSGACLTKEGNAVTGMVNVELIEIFDRSTMLSTNKPTIGLTPEGNKALLISAGSFFIEATQNGEALGLSCPMQLIIPSDLTGGTDTQMTLWYGNGGDNDCDEPCDGAVVWEEITENVEEAMNFSQGPDGEPAYYAYFSNFGWTNVDRFYTDNRPKTTLLVDVSEGFDDQNSVVYLSYDGEPNALAYLDTYDESTGLFSEHYGQIPVGLECHVIFASTDNGQWQYAIKSATIEEDGTIIISDADLQIGTESQLTAALNSLP